MEVFPEGFLALSAIVFLGWVVVDAFIQLKP